MFDGEIDIPCPECGHETSVAIRELETNANPSIVCGGCGKTITINADDFRDKLKDAKKAIEDFKKTLSNLRFKTRS
jgi:transcription elongation factor Elf1